MIWSILSNANLVAGLVLTLLQIWATLLGLAFAIGMIEKKDEQNTDT